jgi:hypothetical protein
MVQQEDGGAAAEFELVPKGEAGDAVIQQADGNYAVQTIPSSGSAAWRYTTTLGAPATGRWSLDNATQDSATILYLHKTDVDGTDLSSFLTKVEIGDGFYIQDQGSSTPYKFWAVDSITDQTTYYEYDITPISLGDDISNTKKCIVSARPNAGTSDNLREFGAKIAEAVAGTVTEVGATTADLIPYIDSVTKEVHVTPINSMIDNARVVSIIAGTVASFGSTATPTAVPVFTGAIQSSSVVLTKTAGDFGVTTVLPAAFAVTITASMLAGNGNNFVFGIYAGDVLCGRETLVSGDGKDVNFAMQCITETLDIADTIELRVNDDGDTITRLDADMKTEFAGL